MRYPETAALAKAAYEASGAESAPAFVAIFKGAIGLRTFWAWMRGEQPAKPMAELMLREFVAGWRPRT